MGLTLLSQQELRDLSGYQQCQRIRGWLGKNGYRYEIGRDGWPRVLLSAVESKLDPQHQEEEWAPPCRDLN